MAYEEYKNGGRCLGRILYQLDKIRIPLRIGESVVLVSNNQLQYSGKNFAEVTWTEQDVPVFKFCEEYKSFEDLQNVYGGLINHYKENEISVNETDSMKTITFSTEKGGFKICLTNERVSVDIMNGAPCILFGTLPDALIFVGKMMKEFER